MPSVTYNGQSFFIDNRRVWVLGASLQYARIPRDAWASRIAAAKQAGFNTIQAACPWLLHEPRKGRFEFDGDVEVRRFVELCGEAGMHVILQIGPYVGHGYDGGGLPCWLMNEPGIRLRESGEAFVEFAGRYVRKLLSQVVDLQVSSSRGGGGPILFIQTEHAWTSGNQDEAEEYIGRINHMVRESGITVPILAANDLWVEIEDAIDTWRGWEDLLLQLRQLRTVQPNAPRLVSELSAAVSPTWGHGAVDERPATMLLRHVAETLASGSQFVIHPFHAGTNHGFTGGRLPGGPDRYVTTSAAIKPPLGETGARGEKYNVLKRIVTFAKHFSDVFSELDPDFHPIVLDLHELDERSKRGDARGNVSIVPQRGAGGRAVFVFTAGDVQHITLLLDDGLRLPIDVGDQRVMWFVVGVDLKGAGKLDYANVCPWAIVDRNVVAFHGTEGSTAYLSINGAPLQAAVPTGQEPVVIEHRGATVVICNRRQIDATYHDEKAVYVGCLGLDEAGQPIIHPDFKRCCIVTRSASIERRDLVSASAKGGGGPRSASIRDWAASSTAAITSGQSPRFASLAGPESLAACGASYGYGWYRVTIKSPTARKRNVIFPRSGDRLHLFLDGEPLALIGVGPGAELPPCELKLARDEHHLVVLADNLGRFDSGNYLGAKKGLFGHIYEVKSLRCSKSVTQAKAVDPFALRKFIAGQTSGVMSDTLQLVINFKHLKKAPVIVDVSGARCSGTFVLNDVPIAYYAGATGSCLERLVFDPTETDAFKRGNNELRFAPDPRQNAAAEEMKACIGVYEEAENITANAAWSFAKWEVPIASSFKPIDAAGAKKLKGRPAWYRGSFVTPEPGEELWFDTRGLSKGQIFVNGCNLGRYFTSTHRGRDVGPQRRFWIPRARLSQSKDNEIIVFDEHGFDPHNTRIVLRNDGELD